MTSYCRSHLRRQAIDDQVDSWTDPSPPAESNGLTGVEAWKLHIEPCSYEEVVAMELGLDVDDLPGWGTAIDLEGLHVYAY